MRLLQLTKQNIILLLALIFILFLISWGVWSITGCMKTDNYKEFSIPLGGDNMQWGCFDLYSKIPSEPKVRVEYLLPLNFNPDSASIVHYAQFTYASNSMSRPQLYKFAKEHNMLIFTIQFDFKNQSQVPSEQKRGNTQSGWYEIIFEVQKILEKKYDIPHKKLFVLGDSSGAGIAHILSQFYSDGVEAAGWLSASYVYEYETPQHPPVLAISTWGDLGLTRNINMMKKDREIGGYSLYMTSPPSWPEKGYRTFHHGSHDIGFDLIRLFFAGIADKRNHNQNDTKDWSSKITANGDLMPSPSEEFSKLWNSYPHNIVNDIMNKEEICYNELIHFPKEDAESVVFYLQDESWFNELWLIDNLYFIAENNCYAIGVLSNDDIDDKLNLLFQDKEIQDKSIIIIAGGDIAIKLKKSIDNLDKEKFKRVTKVVYLNPSSQLVDSLLNSNKCEIWTNDFNLKSLNNPPIIYCNEQGESFGHNYFKVLANVLSNKLVVNQISSVD